MSATDNAGPFSVDKPEHGPEHNQIGGPRPPAL